MVSLIPALTHANQTEANVFHVVNHILHVAGRIGFDHIGIGSDFDGMEKAVAGVEDAASFPSLVQCMISRGISVENIEKIIGLNIIRAMKEAEDSAKRLKATSILEDEVKQLWDDDLRAWVKLHYPLAE